MGDGRVTGLGGVFYKVADPERTRAWYQQHLGIGGPWGANLIWSDEPHDDPYTILSPFGADSDYFAPSAAGFMINLRVDDCDAIVARLRREGIDILGEQAEDYGKFAWITDCDGIKIELWEQAGPAPHEDTGS